MNSKLIPLIEEIRSIATLSSVGSVLNWDQETYMPKGAIAHRSAQSAMIAQLAHDRHSSGKFAKKLAQVVDLDSGKPTLPNLSEKELALLREVYRDWRLATCLPSEFVHDFSTTTSNAQHAWQDARVNNDFKAFQPFLQQVIDLTRKKAELIGASPTPYSALLDLYEPGMTEQVLNPLFEELKEFCLALLSRIQTSSATFTPLPDTPISKDVQFQASLAVLEKMGFDFNRGRQDISTHPFTTEFHPTDVRLTTRVKETNLLECLSGTLHEGGHALYEQGLNPEWYGTPLGQACSLGIHESQSRLWEQVVGMGRAFWTYYFPKLKTEYGYDPHLPEGDFYRSINQVKPGFIRVEADELSYNLHILIRYELEKGLIQGGIRVADLPELWNEKYRHYLGVTVPNDAVGVLQDVHWSAGLIGYFPTYTLGNLYSVCLYEKASADIPNLGAEIAAGNWRALTTWLSTHIYQWGRQYSSQALFNQATGQFLSVVPFINYLKKKYSTIYLLR